MMKRVIRYMLQDATEDTQQVPVDGGSTLFREVRLSVKQRRGRERDKNMLVSASPEESTVCCWDLNTVEDECVERQGVHYDERVTALVRLNDEVVASADTAGFLKIWNVSS